MSGWRQFSGDFNAMTDEEIENEVRRAEDAVAEDQEWLDAVAAWIAEGSPRKEK